ncbi:VOC family protein [Actinopolymorpha pittospori]
MKLGNRMIVFDAADVEAESAFWAGLLGGKIEGGDRWRNIWIDADWQLGVQHAPDHVPPEWPGGAPQQIHLDFYVENIQALDAAHDEVISLGGRLLKAANDRTADHGVQIYADPAGHPFCLCWLPPSA